jgi:hypothetical protein
MWEFIPTYSRCRFYLALLVLFSATGCGGAASLPQSPSPAPSPAPQSYPTPTILRTLYRVVFPHGDRTTISRSADRGLYPIEAQLYYVLDSQTGTGQVPLNRMINAAGLDHADATGPLDGYSLDEVLGYGWSDASLPGVTQIAEGFNSVTYDHAMLGAGESLLGYVSQPLFAYGYSRYGDAGEVLLTLSAGGVEVQSNAVAGGVVWRWTWNGMQFVNKSDYGRQIQAAFYYPPSSGTYNPNEAGDFYPRSDPRVAHGSPLFRFENQGNTQITRAIPLNWDPTAFGGDADHPTIWSQIVLGKDLTLDFNNMGSVAEYTTHLVLPADTLRGIAAPAIYLRANFNRFWTYDAQSRTLSEVTNEVPNGCSKGKEYFFHPRFGGTIMSDASTNFAMGAYAVDASDGGFTSYFSIGKYLCVGDGDGESAGDTVVMNAVRGGGDGISPGVTFAKGESTFNVYLVTDTLQNVTAQMDRLYVAAVK